jgi:2-isopropylmalate synthase
VIRIATDAVGFLKEKMQPLAAEGSRVCLQYSPESFTSTELEFSLEICEAVTSVWQPTPDNKIIINLPATVEYATPNVHADQIEWMSTHLTRRDATTLSLHTHNDRGTGIAATELALLAGADRVEGTLFGVGERTGNLDIATAALNLYLQGIHPGLDFSDINGIRDVYERCTRMEIHPRHPYAGDLAFTAFSGSHQDAIKKSWERQSPGKPWDVLYIPIDPADIGRSYKAIIRINSQSGKGGVAYILSREYGLEIPKAMHPQIGTYINQLADYIGRELSAEEIYRYFREEFLEKAKPLKLDKLEFSTPDWEKHRLYCHGEITYLGEQKILSGAGNGPIDAFVKALEDLGWKDFVLKDFHEHALGSGSDTEAMAYVMIDLADKEQYWGAGRDTNIDYAGIKALICAYNRAHS